MARPGGSCLCSCVAALCLLASLSLAQYESWPHYPEYFQEPAPEYHRPQAPPDVTKIQLRSSLCCAYPNPPGVLPPGSRPSDTNQHAAHPHP